jgi:hypothetical protein
MKTLHQIRIQAILIVISMLFAGHAFAAENASSTVFTDEPASDTASSTATLPTAPSTDSQQSTDTPNTIFSIPIFNGGLPLGGAHGDGDTNSSSVDASTTPENTQEEAQPVKKEPETVQNKKDTLIASPKNKSSSINKKITKPEQKKPIVQNSAPADLVATTTATSTTPISGTIDRSESSDNLYTSHALSKEDTKNMLALALVFAITGMLLSEGKLLNRLSNIFVRSPEEKRSHSRAA